jgi:hypothetical protein
MRPISSCMEHGSDDESCQCCVSFLQPGQMARETNNFCTFLLECATSIKNRMRYVSFLAKTACRIRLKESGSGYSSISIGYSQI